MDLRGGGCVLIKKLFLAQQLNLKNVVLFLSDIKFSFLKDFDHGLD
jgi:hypothetical protein